MRMSGQCWRGCSCSLWCRRTMSWGPCASPTFWPLWQQCLWWKDSRSENLPYGFFRKRSCLGKIKFLLVTFTSTRKGFALYTTEDLLEDILVPLLEELTMRFTLWKLWRGIEDFRKRRTSPQNESDTKDKTKHLNLPTLWLLTSSLIFAGAHIENHLPAPVKNLSAEEKAVIRQLSKMFPGQKKAAFKSISILFVGCLHYGAVLGAMYQSILTFTLSTEMLCPQFLSGGIMASFGAHAAWNTLANEYFLLFNIFLRLVVRLIRVVLVREKTDKCQEKAEQNTNEHIDN